MAKERAQNHQAKLFQKELVEEPRVNRFLDVQNRTHLEDIMGIGQLCMKFKMADGPSSKSYIGTGCLIERLGGNAGKRFAILTAAHNFSLDNLIY